MQESKQARQKPRDGYYGCPPTITLSLPRRVVQHFERRASEVGIPFERRTELMIDYIKQFAVHLLESKPKSFDRLGRTGRGTRQHSNAVKYSLYIGGDDLLCLALDRLSRRYGLSHAVIAKGAFYLLDTNDPRFQFRPLPPKTERVLRDNRINVHMRQEMKEAASAYLPARLASDSYRELIRQFVQSDAPLPPKAVRKQLTGYVPVCFMLSDAELKALQDKVEKIQASGLSEVVRAAFLPACPDLLTPQVEGVLTT